MSKLRVAHPEDGVLLRFLDGELPAAKSRQIKQHLEACWECRTDIDELHKTVVECVRYRKAVLAAYLPPPPNAWADLRPGFERIDTAAAAPRTFGFPQLRWAMAAAASLLAVFGVYYELRQTPSVQAAALLQRAVAAAAAQSNPVRGIQVRTRSLRITRPASVTGAASPGDAAAVYELFQTARYDWENPLSAKAFQDWRSQVSDKRDEVAKTQEFYRIRTTAAQGEVAAASLTLREADLRPVEGRLEFRNHDWVEFSEITEPAVPESGVKTVSRPEVPERAPVPSRAAAVAPGPPASISDELLVLAALHRIGADLGDPIDVSLSNGRVMVSGVGVTAQRQRQIHSILDEMPKVAVEFAEPGPATLPPDTAPAVPAPDAGGNTRLQTRLEAELGGRPQFEKFSAQVLDWNDQAMARAYALRRLAQGFPAGSEAGMAEGDRTALRQIVRDHLQEFTALTGNLQQALTPALTGLGGSAKGSVAALEAASWQPAVEQVFQAARRVEKLLALLSGASPGAGATTGLPSDLLRAMSEERAEIEQCKRLLGGA